MGEKRWACRVLADKAEGKRQLGRPMHKWADNIKINLKETGLEGMEWIYIYMYISKIQAPSNDG